VDKRSDVVSLWLDPAPRDAREQGLSEAERLLRAFEAHEGEEKGFLRDYRAILEKCNHPMAAFLLNLIIADEERHQAVVHSMVATLQGALDWSHPAGAIESPATVTREQAAELRQLTQTFIDEEKNGIREYKKLIRSSAGYYRGLFALLLRIMIHDSEKHVMILEFLRDDLANA
jgi:rubrerythrin